MDFETFKTFVKYAEFDKQTFQYYMGTNEYGKTAIDKQAFEEMKLKCNL